MSPESLARVLEIMHEVRAGQGIATLHFGPYGWGFAITDPDVTGTNVSQKETPEEAAEEARRRWAAKLEAFHGTAA